MTYNCSDPLEEEEKDDCDAEIKAEGSDVPQLEPYTFSTGARFATIC